MDKIIIAFIFTTLLISCNNPIVDLGDGYEYNSECHHIISDHFDIPPYIIEYKFDGNYIIVKQKPTHYFNGIYDYPKEFRKEKYSKGLNATYYWIIDKKDNIVYGPLSSLEFKTKCKDVNMALYFNTLDNE